MVPVGSAIICPAEPLIPYNNLITENRNDESQESLSSKR